MSEQKAIKIILGVILICVACIVFILYNPCSTPVITPSPSQVISINKTIPDTEKKYTPIPTLIPVSVPSENIPLLFVDCTRIQPSGNLKCGTKVASDITIDLYEKFPIEEYIFLNTDLEQAVWEYKVLIDGVVKSTQPAITGKESRIPGWLLEYPHGGVQVVITVTGTTPLVQTSGDICIAGVNILRHTSQGREVLPIDRITAYAINPDNSSEKQIFHQVAVPVGTVGSTPLQSDTASFMDVGPVIIQPQGNLHKGSRITAEFPINMDDTFPTRLDVSMSTNLKDATWMSEIIVNGANNTQPTKEGDKYRINGWMVKYPDSDVQILVSVTGTVPSVQTPADLTIAGIYATSAGGKIVSTAREIKGFIES